VVRTVNKQGQQGSEEHLQWPKNSRPVTQIEYWQWHCSYRA